MVGHKIRFYGEIWLIIPKLLLSGALPYLIPYFLGYKTDFFSFQNNPKDLDPSYKMDLDL